MSATDYSLSSYGRMITCEPRMGAFAEALKRSVTPGCRVIDLGAGPGLFALLACQYGAGHVVAIEPDASIEILRKAAVANGCADKITIVRDLSTNWQTDTRADVVISDIRGVMPFFEHHIPCIIDVRARLLKPDGIQIPGVDRIFAALVEAPKKHAEHIGPWLTRPYGVDLSAAHPFAINSWGRVYLPPEALLCDAVPFATLDYRTITETNHHADLFFSMGRGGTAHGILLWFETELVPGVGYSNAPGAPEQVYGQAFFPLEHPIQLAEGSAVQASVSAHLVDRQYVWTWGLQATDTDGKTHMLRQSSFRSQILALTDLATRAESFCPPNTKHQEIDAQVLTWFDGKTDLASLADRLQTTFADNFLDRRKAFDHVVRLSASYSKA